MSILARNTTISNDKLRELRIDPEFRDKIPPLTDAEFEQLRENILKDGEVYEPICVWHGTIIDGHNRWKVIQENPEIPHRFKEMEFDDKWAAFEWMYRKQLGRRNLTDEQRTYMIGKMYEARKKSVGAPPKEFRQNDGIKKSGKYGQTASSIGAELGIGSRTVERDGAFSQGVDAVKAKNPEAANRILEGKSKLTKQFVSEIPRMSSEAVTALADSIVNGKAKPSRNKPPKPIGRPREIRQINEAIVLSDAAARACENAPNYTVDDLYNEIVVNAKAYVDSLKRTLAMRSTTIDQDRDRIRSAVQDIINTIEKVRNLL